jgi:hypothetical protein
MKNNMKDFINEYKGIIGTIIGTLLGFGLGLVKDYFKNRGKIYYDFSKFELKYESTSEYGFTFYDKEINNLENVHGAIFSLNLKITNASSGIKILKNIIIRFTSDDDEFENVPQVFSHSHIIAGKFNEYKELTLLNLNPYETQEIDLNIFINKENINKEIEFQNIYFEAKDIKNRNIKVKIK